MSETKCIEAHRRSNGPLTCEDCRLAELAAAEERGRRSAETERDELRAALRDAAAALALGANELIRRLNEKREKMSTTEAVNDEVAEAVVRAWGDAKAALAPRDSALAKPACATCGKVDGHWPSCPNKPRDSAPVAPKVPTPGLDAAWNEQAGVCGLLPATVICSECGPISGAISPAELERLAPRDSGKAVASGHAEETDREDRRDDRWANPDLEDRK